MNEFKIIYRKNPNIAYLRINEGNINIETGIRFIYELLDSDKNVYFKQMFSINGEDFSEIGKSGKDTRIAIVELLLETIDSYIDDKQD